MENIYFNQPSKSNKLAERHIIFLQEDTRFYIFPLFLHNNNSTASEYQVLATAHETQCSISDQQGYEVQRHLIECFMRQLCIFH